MLYHNRIPYECHNILYTSPEKISAYVHQQKSQILEYAQKYCPVYNPLKDYYDKWSFSNINNWHVNWPSRKAKTSGTTGHSFEYLIDMSNYYFLEMVCHYRQVLKEYQMLHAKEILILWPSQIPERLEIKSEFYQSHPTATSHGLTNIWLHRAKWNLLDDSTLFDLFKFISEHKIDVVSIDGPCLNRIAAFVRRNNIRTKICRLLSNTNEKIIPEDVNFLKNNGNIDEWCDHMRCWDGGATFMTCVNHTYHLLDNLSYCQEIDKKLICTDYFNFASPFINYWAGDYCIIDNQYKLCPCGRWYRPFKMSQTKNLPVGPITSDLLRQRLAATGMDKCISSIRYEGRYLQIYTKLDIGEDGRNKILTALPEFKNVFFF